VRRAGACLPAAANMHDFQCPRYAAHIHDIGLDDVDGAACQSCVSQVARSQSCSPPSDVQIERIGDELGFFFELPVGTGLLVMADAFRPRASAPTSTGSPRRKAAVRIKRVFATSSPKRAPPPAARSPSVRPGPFIDVPGRTPPRTRHLKRVEEPFWSRSSRTRPARLPCSGVNVAPALTRRTFADVAAEPPRSSTTGLPSSLPAQVPQAQYRGRPSARQAGSCPGNLCSRLLERER